MHTSLFSNDFCVHIFAAQPKRSLKVGHHGSQPYGKYNFCLPALSERSVAINSEFRLLFREKKENKMKNMNKL